ncbi:6-hydroxymethylpterin diphosphokinase MptE-like protein [Candidatus Neomarinimicrobiota bacterium]
MDTDKPFPEDQLQEYSPEQRATVNPYHYAANVIASRLFWDLHWKAWISRARLRKYKNRYLGQKAIILCNGPSLNKVDFSLLEHAGIFTFGLNKINLLFEETSFRPDCIVSMNPQVLDQNRAFLEQTRIPLFLNSSARRLVRFRKNVILLHFANVPRRFARDCTLSMTQGHTVTYAALQLAFHMGFAQVALTGADHSFAAKGVPNAFAIAGETDLDHFHPDYFPAGVTWQLPDMRGIEAYYELARDTYTRYSRQVYNCTEGGKLEIFERKLLKDYLAD